MAPDMGMLHGLLQQARLPEPSVRTTQAGTLELDWVGRDTLTRVGMDPAGLYRVTHEPFPGQSFDVEGIRSPDVLIPVLRNMLRGFVPLEQPVVSLATADARATTTG